MNIGIICYASVGGSGIVATELGKALAARGHQVHFISTETPFRFGDFQAGLTFHQVLTPTYPLFREPQYLLSIANKVVEVARDFSLDIMHAHYAVPHATAAFLAKQVLAVGPGRAPRVVTTLHGTDITLVGNDPSVLGDRRLLDRAVRSRDGGVPEPARLDLRGAGRDARDRGDPQLPRLRRAPPPGTCPSCASGSPAATRQREDRGPRVELPAGEAHRLRDGDLRPHQAPACPRGCCWSATGRSCRWRCAPARELGIAKLVHAVGAQEEVLPLLSVSDVFLLPSAQESFGLAALEAMACGVPVVGVARRRRARGDRARHQRVPARAGRGGRDGRERHAAADVARAARQMSEAACRRVRDAVLRRPRRADVRSRVSSGCSRRSASGLRPQAPATPPAARRTAPAS